MKPLSALIVVMLVGCKQLKMQSIIFISPFAVFQKVRFFYHGPYVCHVDKAACAKLIRAVVPFSFGSSFSHEANFEVMSKM